MSMKQVHIKKINLNRTAKDKILKMLLALFPEYVRIVIGNDGMVKFFRRGLFKLFPRVKIHYLDLCLEGIPRRMSLNRYGNDDLTALYYKKIGALLKHDGISFMVDYLWEEFLKVRTADILHGLNSYIIAAPDGNLVRIQLNSDLVIPDSSVCEDVEIISSDNSITRVLPRAQDELRIEDVLQVTKKAAATLALFVMLNLTPLLTALPSLNIFPNFGQYPGP